MRKTANTRSSNTISPQTPISGMSRVAELPKVLPYPSLLPFEDTPSIHNLFCYIVRHYRDAGISVLIYRQPEKDQVVTIFGDWNGNNIDLLDENNRLSAIALQFANDEKCLSVLLKTMQLIRVEQAQFFFAIDETELVLADMQLSLNKFAGPGMIRDIFGKLFRTQEVLKTEFIDDRAIEFINKGTGSYEGDLILKPSKFRLYHDPESKKFQPLYAEVRR